MYRHFRSECHSGELMREFVENSCHIYKTEDHGDDLSDAPSYIVVYAYYHNSFLGELV
jgi:hypothetical protein